VPQSFADECEIILPNHRVYKNLVSLCSKREEFSARANLDSCDLVRVWNLCNWGLFVAVPEKDRCTLAAGYQFKLTVFALGHPEVGSVCGLPPVDSLFFLEVVGTD
jgi:hypothetical protein